MSTIIDVQAREILDSRGNPTVEVDVMLEDGTMGRAAVPSGASTGAHEAVELRDGDKARFKGKGVLKAVAAVNGEIAEAVMGLDATEQAMLDALMVDLDGTPNKGRLGANAILGVSLAAGQGRGGLRGPAALPLRGRHGGAGPARAHDEHRQRRPARRQPHRHPGVHGHAGGRGELARRRALGLRDLPHPQGRALGRGPRDRRGRRGGLRARTSAPPARRSTTSCAPSRRPATTAGEDVVLALDCAATEYHKDGRYVMEGEGAQLTSEENVRFLEGLASDYPILSIEDGMGEDDWEGWAMLTQALGSKVQLVGDDLFVTNPARLADGIKGGIANSLLVKVNQIGTLTETLRAVEMAHRARYTCVMSHRSGETEDATIADLAVATNCGQIKTGSLSRSDRLAKYNQLIRIEEALGDVAEYAGRGVVRA
jgi:enolase